MCEKCGKSAPEEGNKFCTKCRHLVLKGLREAGYLEPVKRKRRQKNAKVRKSDVELAWEAAA